MDIVKRFSKFSFFNNLDRLSIILLPRTKIITNYNFYPDKAFEDADTDHDGFIDNKSFATLITKFVPSIPKVYLRKIIKTRRVTLPGSDVNAIY